MPCGLIRVSLSLLILSAFLMWPLASIAIVTKWAIAENRELSGSAIVAICGGSGGEGELDQGNPGGGKALFANDECR